MSGIDISHLNHKFQPLLYSLQVSLANKDKQTYFSETEKKKYIFVINEKIYDCEYMYHIH